MLKPELLIEFADQKKPSIAQFDHLTEQIKWNLNLRKHFDVDDDNVWQALYDRITLKQYKYALALMFKREYFKLNELMMSWGFSQKVADSNTKTQTERAPF